jgi:hypothetical protein
MSIRFAAALAACVAVSACTLGPAGLDALAERYVRVTLQMAQHDPSLVEDWRGQDSWRPGPRVPAALLLEEITSLQRDLARAAAGISSSGHQTRVDYLTAQVRGLRFAAERQLGRSTSIDDQFREEFQIEPPSFDEAALARIREAINISLPGNGPLAARVDALRRATTIPRERRAAVIGEALDACRAATRTELPLPHEDRVRVEFRGGLSWDAFIRYAGNGASELAINDDGELDVARALRLACHEGYPGHHIQQLLIDRVYGDRMWPELLLTPGFGPHLLFLEGAAEVGADIALTAQQRDRIYREHLLPAAGLDADRGAALAKIDGLIRELAPVVTDIARQYLDGAIGQQRALERLRDEALVANPAGTLAFIEHRRARALVYAEGRRLVSARLKTPDLAGLHAAFRAAAAVE